MPSPQTPEITYFFKLEQRRNPLAGLELLRDPQIWDNNNTRPFSPGMGNESDAFLRFYQKLFFNARKAGYSDPSWSPRFPNLHFVSKNLVEDYSTVPKSIRSTAEDELEENEELRTFFQNEMAAQGLSPDQGRDLHRNLIQADNNLKAIKRQANMNNTACSDADIEVRKPGPSYSTPLSNDVNRVQGRSYIYTIDNIDDSEDEDEESDDDDYHLYSQAEPATTTQSPAASDGDANIDYSDSNTDSDSDSSDDDNYFSHVAAAGPSARYATPRDENGDFTAQPVSSQNIFQPAYTPTLPTILEQEDFEIGLEQYPRTTMARFVVACKEDTVAEFVQELVTDLRNWNDHFDQLRINHLGFIREQKEKLSCCAWFLVPLDTANELIHHPLTGVPVIILTNPEGAMFELEENDYDFGHPGWDAWWKEREEMNREAQIAEREWRDKYETYEEYNQTFAARRYWADAQEERDLAMWWQEVGERGRAAHVQERSAASTELQQETEAHEIQVEEAFDDSEYYGKFQQNISEPNMSSDDREPLERRLTDPEVYLQINPWNSDDHYNSEDSFEKCDNTSNDISKEGDPSREEQDATSLVAAVNEEFSSFTSLESDSDESDFEDISLFDDDQMVIYASGIQSRNTTPENDNKFAICPPSLDSYSLDLAAFEVEKARQELDEFEAKVNATLQAAKKKYTQWQSFQKSSSKDRKLYSSKLDWIWSVRHFAARLSGMAEEGFTLDKDYQGPGVRFKSDSLIGAHEVLITGALAQFTPDLLGGVFVDLRLLTAWLDDKDIHIKGRSNTELFTELKEMLIVEGTVNRQAVDTYQALMDRAGMKWWNVDKKLKDIWKGEAGRCEEYTRLDEENIDVDIWMRQVRAGLHVEEGVLVVWELGRECFSLIVRDRNGKRVAL